MCERIRKVVTGKSAPVRRHREAALVVAAIRVSVCEVDFVILRAVDRVIEDPRCANEARKIREVSLGYTSAYRVVIRMGSGQCVNGVGRATAVDDVRRPCV
jgi:hypothetical protein